MDEIQIPFNLEEYSGEYIEAAVNLARPGDSRTSSVNENTFYSMLRGQVADQFDLGVERVSASDKTLRWFLFRGQTAALEVKRDSRGERVVMREFPTDFDEYMNGLKSKYWEHYWYSLERDLRKALAQNDSTKIARTG